MAAARGSLYFEDMVHGPEDGLHILAHAVSNDWFQVLLIITVIDQEDMHWRARCIGKSQGEVEGGRRGNG